jgi:anti-sigma factor RsiW
MNPCDHWRESLTEHALGGPAEAALAEHLEKCRDCRAALARMQSIAGEIDRGVRQLAAVEPSADGAARVLAEVASRVERTRWWQPTGRAAAAAFAAVIFLAGSLGVFWRIRTRQEGAAQALSAAAEISSWRSPTRDLLRSPSESVLKGAPRLGRGFYRLDAGGAQTKKSDPREKEKQKQ